jgi:hypothetical protein
MRPARALFVVATFASPLAIVASCVDGVTPDCSDPAVKCGPEADDAGEHDGAIVLPEASRPAPDLDADGGDLDAADEG